jgi:hypothetical protein
VLSRLLASTPPWFDGHRLISISHILNLKDLGSLLIRCEFFAYQRQAVQGSLELCIHFDILGLECVYKYFSLRVNTVLKLSELLEKSTITFSPT